jgi:LmbE family N-acetylglucosaminyl deacetylase
VATRDALPRVDGRRLLVVSPHYDDAVLGCAHLLDAAAEALVVTIFGGRPLRVPPRATTWDRRCGFTPDDDVIARRRDENEQALAELDVERRDLDLVDGQYPHRRYRTDDIAAALAPVVAGWRPTTVAFPLGTGHPDHRLAADGALRLEVDDGSEWLAYAELPYAWRTPDLVTGRLARLRRRYGLVPVPVAPRSSAVKAKALACYSSQLVGLGLADEVDELAALPEQLWRLDDREPWHRRLLRLGASELERRGVDVARAGTRGARAGRA